MRLITFAALPLGFLLIGAAQPATTLPQTDAADRVRAHVEFLASDLLEGRETGTRGHEIAAGPEEDYPQMQGVERSEADRH